MNKAKNYTNLLVLVGCFCTSFVCLSATYLYIEGEKAAYTRGVEQGTKDGRESQVVYDCIALGHLSGRLVETGNYYESGGVLSSGKKTVCTDEQELKKPATPVSTNLHDYIYTDVLPPLTPSGSSGSVIPSCVYQDANTKTYVACKDMPHAKK